MRLCKARLIGVVLFGFVTGGFGSESEYPLFTIAPKNQTATAVDLQLMATNFLFVHGDFSASQIQTMHNANSNFVVLKYANHAQAKTVTEVHNVEDGRRDEVLCYKAAVLDSAIDVVVTNFVLAEDAGTDILLKASTIDGLFSSTVNFSNEVEYVAWIQMDDEFMRIETWDETTGQIGVTRGFDGTAAAAHAAGAEVLAPAYHEDHYLGGSTRSFRFHYDPADTIRWELSLQSALDHVDEGYDGTWYDLLGDDPFKEAHCDGSRLSGVWSFTHDRNYTPDEFRELSEAGIHYVQTNFFSAKGEWPILYGNNMGWNDYDVGDGGESRLIMSTSVKPRPMEGMCIESFAGYIDQAEFDAWVPGGLAVPPHNHAGNDWPNRVIQIMKASRDGVPAVPMMCNAGTKVRMYEELTQVERDDFEDWAYASYLMGIERTGGVCPVVFGAVVFHVTNSVRFAKLEDRYTWPIGDPVETRTIEDFDGYKLPSTDTYARKFSNGLVLVNPSAFTNTDIWLDRYYLDPVSSQAVSKVTMPPESGKILLHAPLGSDAGPAGTVDCLLWLDAANVVTQSAQEVTQWLDINHGYIAVPVEGQPSWGSNSVAGLPGIHFNGLSALSAGTISTNVGGLTVFAVSQCLALENPDQQPKLIACATNNGVSFNKPGWALGAPEDADTQAGIVYALQIDMQKKTDCSLERVTIGARPNLARNLNGDIAELLVFGHNLSLLEESRVRWYLEVKYGLTFDGDGDDMPDTWENLHFGGTSKANGGPEQDWDADGVTNLKEYLAATSPTDPNEYFSIKGNPSAQIEWIGLDSRLYTLYATTNLLDGLWDITTYTNTPGTNGTMRFAVPSSGDARFFKVEANFP
ncbi:MAG: hypothetical protein K9M45_14315 [Kiritimatiellales bacterium]|nr:hypothetical protein [Kiritimatiellales bacterium]